MKTQHTKGEWEITEYETQNEYNQPELDSIQISTSENHPYNDICVLWPIKRIDKKYIEDTYTYQAKETEANAKLIAAAPITTEELYKTTEYLKSLIKNDCIKGVGTIETIKQIIRTNEQAIKKATE